MAILSPMRLGAKFRLRGDLEVQVYDVRTGRRVRRLCVRNMITFNGRSAFIQLLAQDGIDPADFQIASLKAGSNGTPPTEADVALGAFVISKPLESVNRVQSLPDGELVIQAQIEASEAIGTTFREAGVFFRNGQMMARQVYPDQEKTGVNVIALTWRFAVIV